MKHLGEVKKKNHWKALLVFTTELIEYVPGRQQQKWEKQNTPISIWYGVKI